MPIPKGSKFFVGFDGKKHMKKEADTHRTPEQQLKPEIGFTVIAIPSEPNIFDKLRKFFSPVVTSFIISVLLTAIIVVGLVFYMTDFGQNFTNVNKKLDVGFAQINVELKKGMQAQSVVSKRLDLLEYRVRVLEDRADREEAFRSDTPNVD